MAFHYEDYLKKNVSINDVVFNKVTDSDKDVIKEVRGEHIRKNKGFLVLMILFVLFCTWGIISSFAAGFSNPITDIFTLLGFGAGFLVSGYWVYDILSGYQLIRRGVVLAANRIQEEKDNRNRTYQYVFDIYLEESDQSLMSYQVDKEVFSSLEPGDGVVLLKARGKKKVKILADPKRRDVMDVSTIKSGVGTKRKFE